MGRVRWKVWIGDGLDDCEGRALEELGGEGGSIKDDIVVILVKGGNVFKCEMWTFRVEAQLIEQLPQYRKPK